MPRTPLPASDPSPFLGPLPSEGESHLRSEVFVIGCSEPDCVSPVYPQVSPWPQWRQGWHLHGWGQRPGPGSSHPLALGPHTWWTPRPGPHGLLGSSPPCLQQSGRVLGGKMAHVRVGASASPLTPAPTPVAVAAGEEMAGGMAPSAGRHSGLDGLARPAGLSHMRLELEIRAPGLEHERARLGGGGGARPRLLAPLHPGQQEPWFLPKLSSA